MVEFDHIEAFARGGHATVDNVRLLCRAHNGYEAERTFGAEFMRHKRLAAAEARAETKERTEAAARARAAAEEAAAAEQAKENDVIPWLRALGFRADEARCAAELCNDMPDALLEERMRRALSCIHVRGARVVRPVGGPQAATSLRDSGVVGAGP